MAGKSADVATIQLLAAFPREPVFTRNRSLFVGDQLLPPVNAVAAAVASPGKQHHLLAVATLQKELVVFRRTPQHQQWHLLCTHTLPKRITSVSIDASFTHVVVSDAVGDVYRLPLAQSVNMKSEDDAQEQYRLLGHFSTVTSVSLTSNYVATTDRDNKIRVSRYPLSYVIESFCLSHTQFISSVQYIERDLLLSASGDGTIRLWHALKGTQLDCVHLSQCDAITRALSDRTDTKVTQPLLVKFAYHGANSDIALFALHKCDALFAVSGLQQARLNQITMLCKFGHQRHISALSTCEDARIYVSVQGEECIMHSEFKSHSANGQHLQFGKIAAATSGAVREGQGVEGARELLHFEWIARQRKKQMVSNWKGKKRRHVEI